jgi:hypothetical protein
MRNIFDSEATREREYPSYQLSIHVSIIKDLRNH